MNNAIDEECNMMLNKALEQSVKPTNAKIVVDIARALDSRYVPESSSEKNCIDVNAMTSTHKVQLATMLKSIRDLAE